MTPLAQAHTVHLADAPRRSRAVIVRVRAEPAVVERLHAMGLGVGAEILVLRGGLRPTVRTGESRLALGPDLARAIDVRTSAAES
jgi:Fe2+ transport system protein FeoA